VEKARQPGETPALAYLTLPLHEIKEPDDESQKLRRGPRPASTTVSRDGFLLGLTDLAFRGHLKHRKAQSQDLATRSKMHPMARWHVE